MRLDRRGASPLPATQHPALDSPIEWIPPDATHPGIRLEPASGSGVGHPPEAAVPETLWQRSVLAEFVRRRWPEEDVAAG